MTRDEFINSNIYLGKIVFIDSGNNQMWCEELLSSNSKKGKALLKRFPKGGSFTKAFTICVSDSCLTSFNSVSNHVLSVE